MQALTLANGRLHFRADYPTPRPQPGEALIRVLLAGICTTDLEMVKGYKAGFTGVLGHEFVGLVEEAPDPTWIGRRVVAGINAGCGQCAICQSAGPEHCPRRTVVGIQERDGVFADYVALPQINLLAVPEEIGDETAVFTEPLAAAVRIREQIQVLPTGKTAVIGPGRLGLLIGQVLALDGTEVTLIGRSLSSLALPQQLGLPTALAADIPDNCFDLIVEATGNEAGLATALRLIRPLGRIVLKSTFAAQPKLDLSRLVVDEITIIGSRCGPFAPALRLMAQGRVQVSPLIAQEYPLRQGSAAFDHAAQPGVRKVLLRP
jgi:threonine dehydrogenase-like Zn-dependent dehydrogenase